MSLVLAARSARALPALSLRAAAVSCAPARRALSSAAADAPFPPRAAAPASAEERAAAAAAAAAAGGAAAAAAAGGGAASAAGSPGGGSGSTAGSSSGYASIDMASLETFFEYFPLKESDVRRLRERLPQRPSRVSRSDIVDIDSKRVFVIPMLLQIGLLTVVPGRPTKYRPPNEYARRSLGLLLASVTHTREDILGPLGAALRSVDRDAFRAAVQPAFARLSPKELRADGLVSNIVVGALLFAAPPSVEVRLGDPQARVAVPSIAVEFADAEEGDPHTVWALEVAVDEPAATVLERAQARAAAAYDGALDASVKTMLCCAVTLPDGADGADGADDDDYEPKPAVSVAWSQRVSGGEPGSAVVWERLPDAPKPAVVSGGAPGSGVVWERLHIAPKPAVVS